MKKIVVHILFWIAILYWRAKGDWVAAFPLEKFLLHNLVRLPLMIIATYVLIFFILPKYFFEEKNYPKFIGLFLVNFIIATFLDRQIIQSDWIINFLDFTDEPKAHKYFIDTHPFRNTFMLFSIMGLASIIQFFQLLRKKEKHEQALTEENLTTKLAFLKSQVNPHFLFNALNNIYSMAVQKNQPEIAEGLENLSGIMHYLTYESSVDFVPLEKEINLLKNYIDIQHLRVSDTDDTTISFSVEGEMTDKIIAPVILLPLVENAFKHGIKPDEKCLVSIKIEIKNTNLIFKTTNSFFQKSDKEIHEKGIGIENVTKRLQLLYPDKFTFDTRQDDDFFYTILQLNLL